jgi:hypothetical protein
MANSRDRRKLRRQPREAPLGQQLQTPLPRNPESKVVSDQVRGQYPLRRIPAWGWLCVVVLATAITLLEGYPWLSVQEGERLDPSNPFSELLLVSNEGYVPLVHLDALCQLNLTFENGQWMHTGPQGGFLFEDFSEYLGHGNRATIPCFRSLDTGGRKIKPGATLTVRLSYAFPGLNLRFLRRSQSFRLKSVVGVDGLPHWTFM